MLSREILRQWSVKWQTTELNVIREYLQHLFLSALYPLPQAAHLAFKGGTALRLAFGSPRFSEDLDFSTNLTSYHLRGLFKTTVERIQEVGVDITTQESKPTSGGYLTLYTCEAYGQQVTLSCNVSSRKKINCEAMLIATPLLPSYQCLLLATQFLVQEKIEALLERKKPRDFFDLYFLLRDRRSLAPIITVKAKLLKEVDAADPKNLQRELKVFLPVSFHRIVANLPAVLRQEIERL